MYIPQVPIRVGNFYKVKKKLEFKVPKGVHVKIVLADRQDVFICLPLERRKVKYYLEGPVSTGELP